MKVVIVFMAILIVFGVAVGYSFFKTAVDSPDKYTLKAGQKETYEEAMEAIKEAY